MHLEDVFNNYTKYTGSNEVYNSSDFSRKLKNTFKHYNLDKYLKSISPKNKKPFDINTKYEFTEDEAELFGLLIGCTTSSSSTNPTNYAEKSILNPFLHINHRKSLGISDMKKYTDNFLEQKAIHRLPQTASQEVHKISTFIDFAFKLKDCLKRLIIAIFYMNNFNTMTFDRILARLNGFIDELYLLGSNNEDSHDIYYTLNQTESFHSVDILTAASVGDHIYCTKHAIKPNIEKLIRDKNYRKKYNEEIKKTPKYTPLLNSHPLSKTQPCINKDYKEYIRRTIYEMYKTYETLISGNSSQEDIFKTFLSKFNCNIFLYSVESQIFNTYIEPYFQKTHNNTLNLDEAAEETYKTIEELLSKAAEKALTFTSENDEIDNQLDMLLFKPFVRFHDIELQNLKSKAKENEELL